jgi:uncharacterized membrane protein YheB (UPF0754 family)
MATELEEMEEAATPIVSKTLTSLMRDMLAQYEADDMVSLPTDANERVGKMLNDVYQIAMRGTGQNLVDNLKNCFPQLETKQDEESLFEKLIAEYLERFGAAKIFQITETTRKQIMGVIKEGQKEGLGSQQIADLMRAAIPSFSRSRSMLIARTETHGSSQFASLRTAQQSTRPLVKKWNSVEDARTRSILMDDTHDHRVIDGQRVALEQSFMVPTIFGTKEPLLYPGDPNGTAGNVINCRCSMTYRRADRDSAISVPTASATRRSGPFEYESFVAPTSVAAMNKFITDKGLADSADLKGLNVKATAPQLKAILEVKERFGLKPLAGIGPISRYLPRTRTGKNVEASVYTNITNRDTGNRGILNLPTKFGKDSDQIDLARGARNRVSLYQDTQEDSWRNISATIEPEESLSERYNQMRNTSRSEYLWTVGNTEDPERRRNSTIFHEYGHVIHLTERDSDLSREINKFLKTREPRKNHWDILVSKYSSQDDDEYIAETFALYMMDESEHYRIHPELLKLYKRYDRANNA